MRATILTLSTLATFYALTLNGCKSEQNWYNLKSTYYGWFDQPRTVAEAEKAGWTKLDESLGCKNVNKGKTDVGPTNKKQDDKEMRQIQLQRTTFWGHRYAPPGELKEMLLIYDVNGFIAGMQSVVPKEDTLDDKYYKFSSSPIYNLDIVNGSEVYLTTAYFVDPNIICECGRTQEDFDRDGTGNKLFFQIGQTTEDLLEAPLTANEAYRDENWYEHNCYPKMGVHWSRLNNVADDDGDQPCEEEFPVDLTFEQQGDQTIVAFVWKHVAGLKGAGFEVVTNKSLGIMVKNAPSCMYDVVKTPGMRTHHVYLKDYNQTCSLGRPGDYNY